MGGQVRPEVLRVPAGPRLPGRNPGRVRGRQGQEPEASVGSGRGPGIGVRPDRPRPHSDDDRRVPGQGNDPGMVEGWRGRARSAAPHRGRCSSRRGRCCQPRAAEHRPERDGTGRRGPLPIDRFDQVGLPDCDPLRRRSRRSLPHQAGRARDQGEARRVAGAQRPGVQRGQDARRHPRRGVGSSRGAVPALPPVRFPDPPAEPDVPIPEHPALHRTRDGRS